MQCVPREKHVRPQVRVNERVELLGRQRLEARVLVRAEIVHLHAVLVS